MAPPEKKRIAVILGTRPEAIKLAPVILALRQSSILEPWVVSTAQHRDLIAPVFANFGLKIDQSLTPARTRQSLASLTSHLLLGLDTLLKKESRHFCAVLVQGDTTTAFTGGLCGFYHGLSIGHVEAGLRTFDLKNPFPEEANRSMLARIARWHFAPTALASSRLAAEGVPEKSIHVVGNTIADSLNHFTRQVPCQHDSQAPVRILVTCHRRESWGKPHLSILQAIKAIVRDHPQVEIIFPVHPNPLLRKTTRSELAGMDRITCLSALDYPDFIFELKRSSLVLTDSGGVHEEATLLSKPVILLRSKTERSEGLVDPDRQLAGWDSKKIRAMVSDQLKHPFSKAQLRKVRNAFGSINASRRIVRILEKSAGRAQA